MSEYFETLMCSFLSTFQLTVLNLTIISNVNSVTAAGANKMNGSVSTSLKNRPRIPTPDVSKENVDTGKIHSNQQDVNSGHEYPSQYPLVQVSCTFIIYLITLSNKKNPSQEGIELNTN